jgi:hypothetical protein
MAGPNAGADAWIADGMYELWWGGSRRPAELEGIAAAGEPDRGATAKLSDDTIVYWWSRSGHDIPGPGARVGDRSHYERDNEPRPTPALQAVAEGDVISGLPSRIDRNDGSGPQSTFLGRDAGCRPP